MKKTPKFGVQKTLSFWENKIYTQGKNSVWEVFGLLLIKRTKV